MSRNPCNDIFGIKKAGIDQKHDEEEKNSTILTMNNSKIGVKVDLRVVPQHGLVQTTRARFAIPGQAWLGQLEYTGWLKIKTSRTASFVIGILLLFLVGFLILFSKIQSLEMQNDALELKMKLLLCKLDGRIEGEPDFKCDRIRFRPLFPLYGDDSLGANKDDDGDDDKSRILNNNKDEQVQGKMIGDGSRNTSRVKRDKNSQFQQQQQEQQQSTDQVVPNESRMNSSANSSNKQLGRSREARAAFIVVNAPEVNIQQKGQLIGPWYISKDGHELGFGKDLWYNNLALNRNSNAVVFQESGIYLIYAQVYYHIIHDKHNRAYPVGFRISVKKNPMTNPKAKQPIYIAECVPSHPETAYSTCFTQAAWYIEKGDQVFLEHFLSDHAMVETGKQGQTFLGVVRL